MHYGEKEHLVYNSLEVVFYKHETSYNKYKYELTSIQFCKLIHPKLLKDFLEDPLFPDIKKKLHSVKAERFYKVYLKQNDEFYLEVQDIVDVTNDTDEFNQLH